ncbi:Klc [Symbiodinium natans]|uniref:Klc protein n=1 Tax=Symbiodinium natans TaxID=878477 RepID=A0A812SAL2_9DINO|nr:Klc [Symbiodinium natans]
MWTPSIRAGVATHGPCSELQHSVWDACLWPVLGKWDSVMATLLLLLLNIFAQVGFVLVVQIDMLEEVLTSEKLDELTSRQRTLADSRRASRREPPRPSAVKSSFEAEVGELPTFRFDAVDGPIHVWQHAFDLRDVFGTSDDGIIVLYHYTSILPFENVANLDQSAAELFASLVDKRAHFGKGVYASQHEPSVWKLRLRVLLNNDSNSSPFSDLAVRLVAWFSLFQCGVLGVPGSGCKARVGAGGPEDEEAQRVCREWGEQCASGHRGAFCIPMLVPKAIAHNIFERQTRRGRTQPELAKKVVRLGEDYKGMPVDRARDVWVVRVVDGAGEVRHASAKADTVLRLLRLRLAKSDDVPTSCAIRWELARRLQGRGLLSEAEETLKKCLSDAVRAAPRRLVPVMNNLAAVIYFQWRFLEAEATYRKVLEMCPSLRLQVFFARSILIAVSHASAKSESNDISTLTAMGGLATTLRELERLKEAEKMASDALSGCQRLSMSQQVLLASAACKCCLQVLLAQNRLEEAEPLYREGLEGRAAKGEHHPETLTSIFNLGILLKKLGRLEEAEALVREAAEKSSAAKLGHRHFETLNCLEGLAAVVSGQEEEEEEEKLLLEVFEARESVATLGEGHPATLRTLRGLAWLRKKQGRLAESEAALREALESSGRRAAEQIFPTVESLASLAELLSGERRFEEAEVLLREALRICRTELGEPHPRTLKQIDDLAVLLQVQGRLDEMEPLLQKALSVRRAELGETHPDTLKSQNNMAMLLVAKERVEEAESLFRTVLKNSQSLS